jgi:hypothetical protein
MYVYVLHIPFMRATFPTRLTILDLISQNYERLENEGRLPLA